MSLNNCYISFSRCLEFAVDTFFILISFGIFGALVFSLVLPEKSQSFVGMIAAPAHIASTYEGDSGEAVLCDYICTSLENGTSKCEWYCKSPEIQVSCNFCSYTINDGHAVFECSSCDTGTY